MGWPRFVPEIIRKSQKRGALGRRRCQRPSSAVLHPVYQHVGMSVACWLCRACTGLEDGFYGVVGQWWGQQGLSVAVPGGVGGVPEWSRHSSTFPGPLHAVSQLGP